MTSTPTKTAATIALHPRLQHLGGPTSFQTKLIAGFEKQDINIHFDLNTASTRVVLVNGGSKHLLSLWRAKKKGIRIVQRLNGMNWIHRQRKTGVRHYLRSEYGNWNLSYIRKNLANHVVYQSQFSKQWWETRYGQAPVDSTVIFNGVDLDFYTPDAPHLRPKDHIRLLMVEGHLGGGHEEGLLNAIRLVVHLSESLSQRLELMVVGEVSDEIRFQINSNSNAWITWAGEVEAEHIPAFDRSAHLFFSADINAACPNSVIEAIACGLPVVAFDTGSLAEILQNDAGKIADYGADYWKLEPANISNLSSAALKLLQRLPFYRQQARARALAAFGLDEMIEKYKEILLPPS